MAVRTATYGKLAIKMRLTNPGPPPNQLFGIWYHRTMGQADEQNNAGLVAVRRADERLGALCRGPADPSVRRGRWFAADGATGFALRRHSGRVDRVLTGQGLRTEGTGLGRLFRSGRSGLGPAHRSRRFFQHREHVADLCELHQRLHPADHRQRERSLHRGAGAAHRAAGSVTFNYGILAPGAYTATLTCNNGTSASQAFTINAPPTVTVIDPDITGGADFATDVLGNPWDLADAADVPLLNDVTNPGSVLDAGLPALQATGTASGDPQVTLLNGGARPHQHATLSPSDVHADARYTVRTERRLG